MKILIADHGVYNGAYKVGGQHLAENFSKKGFGVLYLSGMLNIFSFRHLFKKTHFSFTAKKMFNYWIKNGVRINSNLKTYTPLTILPFSKKIPFGTTDFVISKTLSFTVPNLFRYLRGQGFFGPDVLITTTTPFAQLLEKINAKVKILRITDNTLAFRDIPKKTGKIIDEAIKRADIVLVTSMVLKEKIERKKNVFYFPNGVDFEFFQNADKGLPKEYRGTKGKRVIYIGAIDYWFDAELLYFLAKNLSSVNFFLIGSPRVNLNQLKELSNVHILGIRSHQEIPKYLWNADAGIIPFKKAEPIVETVSPIKLYEYMTCGLPVVSTEWEELKRIEPPAFLAKNKSEFLSFLKEVLYTPQDKVKFLGFARANSWDNKVEVILNYIDKYLTK